MGPGLNIYSTPTSVALRPAAALASARKRLQDGFRRLSTGLKVASAADSPAGLVLAVRMGARSASLQQAMDNIQNARNLLSTAENGLVEIHDILRDMKTKSLAAANDVFGDEERRAIQDQLRNSARQIDRIVGQTTFGGKKLLDGLAGVPGNKLVFQTGPDAGDQAVLGGLKNVGAAALGIAAGSTRAATAGVVLDGADILAAGGGAAAAAVSNQNLSELKSGRYTIEVTYGTSSQPGDASTVRLLDENGQAVLIDVQAAGNAVDAAAQSLDFSGTGSTTVDFGNGLHAVVQHLGEGAAKVEGQVYTAQVDYTAQVTAGLQADSAEEFAAYAKNLEAAFDTVTGELTKVAGVSSRLDYQYQFSASALFHLEDSLSQTRDADFAGEQKELLKLLVLQKANASLFGQVKNLPMGLLSLLES